MTIYRVKVSIKNNQSSVHALHCNVVSNGTVRTGVFEVHATSAKEAARNWDADSDYAARKLPLTKICPCCHE
jgi:hypothetical protein